MAKRLSREMIYAGSDRELRNYRDAIGRLKGFEAGLEDRGYRSVLPEAQQTIQEQIDIRTTEIRNLMDGDVNSLVSRCRADCNRTKRNSRKRRIIKERYRELPFIEARYQRLVPEEEAQRTLELARLTLQRLYESFDGGFSVLWTERKRERSRPLSEVAE